MVAQSAEIEPAGGTSVYVYDGVVRLWHWLNVLCVFTLIGTGILIAAPLGSVTGEASANFLMGYIRFTHFTAAYLFAVLFLVRFYWAWLGNEYSSEIFLLPIFRPAWWKALKRQMRWYFFVDPLAPKHIGHNPLGHFFMFVFIVLSVFMMVTGFALYSEGKGSGSWQDHLFGWVVPFFGGSQSVHSWHHLGMWMIVCFLILHIYAAIREEVLSRQSMLSAIISGTRTFKD